MALPEGHAAPASTHTDDARFGEAPLAQTVAAAAAMRRLSSLLVSLEHPHRTVDAMLEKFTEWEGELSAAAPADSAPRIGEMPDDPRRVYLNHATDIGAYNPCFPEYRFAQLDAEKATGCVDFPVIYEGPRDWCMADSLACSSTALSSITIASPVFPAKRGPWPWPSGGPHRC